MNSRIRELSDIAYANHLKNNPYSSYGRRSDYDKEFAELIIRECAELTLSHRNDDYYNGWLDYRDEIRRHFGVDD